MRKIIYGILFFAVSPFLSIVSAYFLQDTLYESNSKRIDRDAFSIVKSIVYPDSLHQYRYYIIRNNTGYAINKDNFTIQYSSNIVPDKVRFATPSGITRDIHPTKIFKEIFKVNLPDEFKNENYYTVCISYKSYSEINDKLILTVESKDDGGFANFDDKNTELNEALNNTRDEYRFLKSIVIGETCIIICVILTLLIFLGKFIENILKQKRDDQIINNGNNDYIDMP